MEFRSISPLVFVTGSLALVVLLFGYRFHFPSSDLGCNPNRWLLDKNLTIDAASTTTIAQFLKEKVERGLQTGDEETNELAGLDFSTQALLSGIVKDLKKQAESGALKQQDEGLLNISYGVARVVRRLVVSNAYRTSPKDFTVIALSPDFTIPTSNPDFAGKPPKDPAVHRTCTWVVGGDAGAPRFRSAEALNNTGRTRVGNGVVNFVWIGENHGTTYDCVLIHCSFPHPVGLDSDGGFLYLNISHGSEASSPAELAPVLREPASTALWIENQVNASLYDPDRSIFLYEFAYCSGTVFSDLTAAQVKEFLMYHHSLLGEKSHFFVYYTRRIDDDTMRMLRPLVDQGLVTLVDFLKESEYDTWYHGQVLAINDCLYRTRLLAKWTLFWDLDEYLHVSPPLTLPALLQRHEDSPWISFGKMDFSRSYCAPNDTTDGVGEKWAVERMLYRQKGPVGCELCVGSRGSRKWMANPRKVGSGSIHSVGTGDTAKGGVNLPTYVARMNHYRGLVAPRTGAADCQHIAVDANATSIVDPIVDNRNELRRDEELATLVTSWKKSAHLKHVFQEST